MPRNSKNNDTEDLIDDSPPTIEPYTVLGIEKSATPDEIKSAYRKAALKHHPDKAPADGKDEAHTKFQEVAFAYAVLSDPVRRKRYDKTGSTAECIDGDEGFNWSDFYAEQFRDVVTEEAINSFAKIYKGSDEEKDDLLAAYEKFEGSWDGIFETVMLSDPLKDERRFKKIIDEAIKIGDVETYEAYTQETKASKKARKDKAIQEKQEADVEAHAKKSGVYDKLYTKKGKNGKMETSEDSLAALIKSRQSQRGSFLDRLEEKYAAQEKAEKAQKKKKGKKRIVEDEDEDVEEGEPSEEAFQAAAAKLKKPKAAETEGRKSKRAKH